jgi:1,2-phenylacetyl-CoA epoxidase catalytic subunit
VERVLSESRDLLYPLAWEQVLVSEGVLPGRPSLLRGAFLERVAAELHANGLQMPQLQPAADARCCGRMGQHGPDLERLLATMGEVWRSDPAAVW